MNAGGRSLLVVGALVLGLALRAGDEAGIRIGGAGAGSGPMRVLGEGFAKVHPGARVDVVPNLGSSGGIKALLAGEIDLAVSARPLKAEESGAGARAEPYGRTPFVFIAHPGVSQDSLGTEELVQILEGALDRWPQGPRVRLVLRPRTDIDSAILASLSPRVDRALTAAHARPGLLMAITDQEALAQVGRITGGLGATTLALLRTEPSQVKVLKWNGVEPSLAALGRGDYRLSKTLALVAGPRSPALALAFLRFVLSPKGRALLAKTGHVPVTGEDWAR